MGRPQQPSEKTLRGIIPGAAEPLGSSSRSDEHETQGYCEHRFSNNASPQTLSNELAAVLRRYGEATGYVFHLLGAGVDQKDGKVVIIK